MGVNKVVINDEVLLDLGGDTVKASALLKGYTAHDKTGTPITGTMPDNGAVSPSELAAGGSYTIPAGYHNGSGKVTAKSLASQTDGTAAAGDILSGKTAYVDGSKVTGSMTDQGTKTATLDTSTTSYTIPAGKHSGSGKVSITTQEKSVTPGTSAQTVKPDSGKVLSKVSVGAVTSATQATPSISVSSSGLITASATQTAGYVAAGTKSATKQLTTKGATTITPSASVQTAVSAGTYCTGDIKVAASSGKTVYSGTITISSVTSSISVSVGVSLSSKDTFVLFVNPSSSSNNGYTTHAVASCMKTPDSTAITCMEEWWSEEEGSWIGVVKMDSPSITYSGTTVTIKTGGAYYRFYNCSYTWYLIKE